MKQTKTLKHLKEGSFVQIKKNMGILAYWTVKLMKSFQFSQFFFLMKCCEQTECPTNTFRIFKR